MVSRFVSLTFVLSVLVLPLVGMAALVSQPAMPQAVSKQKGLCMTSGLGCGTGHMLLPALSRP
ncbi:hypothetical protein GWI72_08520 [Microvirga tunisiensis]|uniref:Uncharacterized protein n=2 Tax=Pannonibacter tanglangensis TaxID=2750084 RepID=A0ABW9ZF18_9HYPH|nr:MULTISPECIES: hypothetical protein [unclassified Pannonibacter]NBN62653.1 hypothetical protein [Pannonibacter sp. XCT-34]NBN78308.1 hypothetical protein [Pannonibacter sp. XCT-53]